MSISALIIARDEELKIKNCLEKLSFVDEIIVVLDRSKDETKKIAESFTKKIYSGYWEFEGDRRNFGIKKCTSDWILEIDADEIVNQNLKNEIIYIVKKNKHDFFYIGTLNYVEGKPIKHGWMSCLAPDGKFCLFRKGCKSWENQRVHPNYKVDGEKGKKLDNHIDHKMSENISELILRFNRNTDLKAEDLLDSKKNLSNFFSKRKIFSRFVKCYITRRGYKEGLIGLLISILSSIYSIVSATKAQSLNKTKH